MHETLTHIRHSHKIIPLFIANFFIALHYILVIYINSSFLKEFLSARSISALYTCGAILSFILFIFAPKLVKKVSNFKFLISIFAIEAFALLTMAFTSSVLIVVLGFLLYFITVYAIFYSMDVFLETAIKKEHHTGILRAVYLTIANLGIILGPSLLTFLAHDGDYTRVYIAAALSLLPAGLLAYTYFEKIGEPKISHFNLRQTISDLRKRKNVRRIIFVNFILQFFFAWMVIYTPIYLHENIGIPWKELGFVLSFMLLPFVLFQLPAGELADRFWGEKELLVGGVVIMLLSTAFIPFLTTSLAIIWAITLFITRIGASIVEISSDTYFFRQVTGDDANLISAYRAVIPLALILAPIVFSLTSYFLNLRNSYFILALAISIALVPLIRIRDTK
ncbi:MAG: hypothetical protein A2741_02110 [Candidatus Zambryskibacteria bacterium RIFCSPHIGHO2_01_FULL_43_27]|uniref:Major facilitator superfamily (MFS) profile domain-containing protein n=1 Tax=Candidatus Zambryskibacteria bacterium RIFCSPLOWO2_01_FULL_43_17 TaxID=1802760 RepID=A0A1G2U2X1_9BACT|nr:MAG: hypothetical protein A2741_02110 [Candidatus Zambryskibacteria bacterium RIFCSPHIGHO2_01_FULL_43_27]OHA99766.1 MAG: hypothetical protein A3E93_00830 [Candidatus Zambryskibacteria bacterium RIFCSPHIGHO2_12_FULL_43_12b]OHB03230.1 MAG: hypothetical protein A2920_02590 [Candidatus Zambryskibacteria bacterium RIFCSPLOWO2_01_FULL_43_17]